MSLVGVELDDVQQCGRGDALLTQFLKLGGGDVLAGLGGGQQRARLFFSGFGDALGSERLLHGHARVSLLVLGGLDAAPVGGACLIGQFLMLPGQVFQVLGGDLMVGVQALVSSAEFFPAPFDLAEVSVELLVISQPGKVVLHSVQL